MTRERRSVEELIHGAPCGAQELEEVETDEGSTTVLHTCARELGHRDRDPDDPHTDGEFQWWSDGAIVGVL